MAFLSHPSPADDVPRTSTAQSEEEGRKRGRQSSWSKLPEHGIVFAAWKTESCTLTRSCLPHPSGSSLLGSLPEIIGGAHTPGSDDGSNVTPPSPNTHTRVLSYISFIRVCILFADNSVTFNWRNRRVVDETSREPWRSGERGDVTPSLRLIQTDSSWCPQDRSGSCLRYR